MTSAQARRSDCLVLFPPPSPSDTNPPLGPAILARTAQRHGVRLDVLDLNALNVARFRQDQVARPYLAIGDHGKDRPLLSEVAGRLFDSFGLRGQPTMFVPDCGDPVAGMHYSFEVLDARVRQVVDTDNPLKQFLVEALETSPSWPTAVLGLSVMGPSQVFVSLVLLKLAKRLDPSIVTVLGGSHATLLAREIRTDARYGGDVDFVLPGHCEEELVRLVAETIGTPYEPVAPGSPPFEYSPLFTRSQLSLYPEGRVTLPLQLTRGCYYAKCTYCTYPVVEPVVTKLDVPAAIATIEHLVDAWSIRRFSLKDSLFTPPMLERLAKGLLGSGGTPIEWSVTTKVDKRLITLAPLLAAAGLRTVELGIETIHPKGQKLFAKPASGDDIAEVISALAAAGIVVIVNLIFGLPGERESDAEAQLDWYLQVRESHPAGRIDCSLNMLEIVKGSPLASTPDAQVRLIGAAPWAYCYEWDAPSWRRAFLPRLASVEALPVATAPNRVVA